MTDHAFKVQHLTHSILGYSQNPSNDVTAPRYLGSLEAAAANNFQTLEGKKAPILTKRELKRKRNPKGDLEVVEGEGAYMGPWTGWEGEHEVPQFDIPEDVVDEEVEDHLKPPEGPRKQLKAKRSVFGQEASIFHGKTTVDYQGRTYMHPPLSIAPHLTGEAGSQECFIPKACVHTFTGHTQGVSVIRTLPQTGHLMLSGSMDTKIKVGVPFEILNLSNFSCLDSCGMCTRMGTVYVPSWVTLNL